jgi:RNA polymerase sigma-70 factor (ECF subfamily)
VAGQDDALIIGASLEEPYRFEEIFDRHYQTVRRYAQRAVGPDAGEEVAAQAFLEAFAHRERFDAAYSSARPWLLGIATNLIRHHARSERVHWTALRRMTVERDEEDPANEDGLDAARTAPAIVAALATLAQSDRDAFLMYALGELTYPEVAEAMGIPVGTVRSKIFRVRRVLRERLVLEGAISLQYAEGREG